MKSLIFPELNNESLLSIGQICDRDCQAIFDKNKMKIMRYGAILAKGYRDRQDGLWKMNMSDLKMNYIIQKP